MKWINKHLVEIFSILIGTFLVINLLLSAYEVRSTDGTVILMDFLQVAIPSALISIGIIGLIKNRKLINVIVLIIGGLILYQNYSFEIKLLSEAITGINNKLSLSRQLIYQDFSFLLRTVSILLILVSFLSSYIFPWNLLIINITVIFFLWAVDYFIDPSAKLVPFILFWTFLIAYQMGTSRDEKSKGYTLTKIDYKGRLFQIVTMALIAAVLSLSLSFVRKGPYYDMVWMRANDFLMQDDFLSGTRFLDTFSLMKSGYNDSSTRLGGNVTLNDEVALSLSGKVPTYLRGNTKYVYTGRIWERNDNIYRTENTASNETLKYYSGYSKYSYEVNPVGVNSMSLFVPSYPESVNLSNKQEQRVYYSINDQTFMDNIMVKDPYKVTYFDETGIRAKAFSNSEKELTGYEDFLRVPDSVTDRTKELTLSIVEGINTNAGKAAAIRQYLKDNQTYSLEPGDVPSDEDFVDYFLFEVKEGYCVYYASALTIMLRIAGIPARYAEGFLVFDEKEDDGSTTVRNSDAHAWTEMLTDPENGVWTIIDATGTPRSQSGVETPETEIPQTSSRPTNSNTSTTPRTTAAMEDEGGNLSETNEEAAAGRNNNLTYFLILSIPIILLYLIKMLRVRHMVYSENPQSFNNYLITILKESNVDIADSDTLLDVSKKVNETELSRMIRMHAEYTNAAHFGGKNVKSSSMDNFVILDQLFVKLGRSRNKVYAFFREYLI
ncbi:MAG: transglutaminase-like domain-containing protein [Clostridiaceae bacterium]